MSNGLIQMVGGVDVLAKANPSGRLGRAEDFAAAVVYLASRAGSHVNGAVLVIDGGGVVGGEAIVFAKGLLFHVVLRCDLGICVISF